MEDRRRDVDLRPKLKRIREMSRRGDTTKPRSGLTKLERIGERLRTEREVAGLTYAVLAQRTGLSEADLTRIEAGRKNVTIEELVRYADSLGMHVMADLVPLDAT